MKKIVLGLVFVIAIVTIMYTMRNIQANKEGNLAAARRAPVPTLPDDIPGEERTDPETDLIPYIIPDAPKGCLEYNACDFVGYEFIENNSNVKQGPSCTFAWMQVKDRGAYKPSYAQAGLPKTLSSRDPNLSYLQSCLKGKCTIGIYVATRTVFYDEDGKETGFKETRPLLFAQLTKDDANLYRGTNACDAFNQIPAYIKALNVITPTTANNRAGAGRIEPVNIRR